MDRQLNEYQREKVLKRDGYRCRYCGALNRPFELDHVYPFIKGGETTLENIVTSCKPCNRKKKDKVGIWPKPIGHFDKPVPSFLSGFLSTWSVFLWGFGIVIYFVDPWWSFYTIIFGAIVGFFAIHTKRVRND